MGQLECTISRWKLNHLMRDKNQRVAGREKNNKKSEVGEGSPLADFSKIPENDERYINFSLKEDHAIFSDDHCHGKAMASAQNGKVWACSSELLNTRMMAAYRAACACSIDACMQHCMSMHARCSSSLPERTRQTTTFRRVLCEYRSVHLVAPASHQLVQAKRL